jgi:acetylornithine/N-succinyldiaminopimelate aminotransferase
MPIGACLARGAAAEVLGPGSHGSTFGGNPLACRAAQAVLETLRDEDLVAHAAGMGQSLLSSLRQRLAEVSGVREVRGLGLMLGIELDRPCGELVTRALEAGLLINVTADRVVRLLPPLILEQTEADWLSAELVRLIKELLAPPGGEGREA